MLDRTAGSSSAQGQNVGYKRMSAGGSGGDSDTAQRFRVAALPHLDSVYTLARYLMRNSDDADDAVQECYLRGLRYFDGFHGLDIKPWLMAILRNVCHAEFASRSGGIVNTDPDLDEDVEPIWQEAPETPETVMLRRSDTETIQRLVASLPNLFREVIVLREINDLSYREIAEIVGAPIGTVMSRLARARSMLREAWIAAQNGEEPSK
jgi:RNA polymerase sigma-70 factor (ECF subfamily)